MQEKRKYLSKTWYDSRLEILPSPIQGNGMFATQAIQEGETVVINGGTVLSDAEFQAYITNLSRYNAIQIGEDAHMVEIYATPDELIGGMNHSCDSNLWMSDEVTFVARKAIAVDEEVTVDYALFTTIAHWVLEQPCCCGSPVCRQTVSGSDWQRKDVRERYRDHFSPFINERIRVNKR
jgi:hypothetical protein